MMTKAETCADWNAYNDCTYEQYLDARFKFFRDEKLVMPEAYQALVNHYHAPLLIQVLK